MLENKNFHELKKVYRNLEDNFRAVVDASMDAIFISIPEGPLVFANKAASSLFDMSERELLEITRSSIMDESDPRFETALEKKRLTGKYRGRLRFRKKGGELFEGELTASTFTNDKGHQQTSIIVRDLTDQIRMEEARHKSEKRYEDLVKNANSIILHWGPDGRITFLNEFGLNLFGYSPEEIVGKHVLDTIVPDTESTGRDLKPLMEDICQNPHLYTYNINENVLKNGKRVWIAWTNKALLDKQGDIDGILSIGSDITERKAKQRSLREAKERIERQRHAIAGIALDTTIAEGDFLDVIKKIQEIIADVIRVDRVSTWLFSNDCETMHCMDLYEVGKVTHSREAVLEIADYPRYFSAIRRESRMSVDDALTDPRTSEFAETYLKPLGISSMLDAGIHVSGKLVGVVCFEHTGVARKWQPDEEAFAGTVGALIGQALVNEERLHAQKALSESEGRYRALVENSSDAILMLSAERKILSWNRAFELLFGYRDRELQGQSAQILHATQESFETYGERAYPEIHRTGSFRTEWEFRRKDGSLCPTESITSLIQSPKQTPAEYVSVIRDITDRKQLEAQLQHAQKMEAIGTLAGGVAHDFNNLLTGILGRTSLLALNKAPSHPDFEHIQGIEQYGKRAAGLTGQLLGFAKGGKYEVKPTRINDLIEKSAAMFGRTRKEILIQSEFQEDVWTIDVDRGQMDQVLMNLFVNAWQAMPGGGKLSLGTENVVLDERFINAFSKNPGKYVKITVADTGTGMDRVTRKRIFDPFFTTKDVGSGTGLGLSSAYGIINNHGGFIDVYSREGEGTKFSVYLPASAAVVEETRQKKTSGIQRGSETVLLIDDEPFILDVGLDLLTAMGYQVITAPGGKEGISRYEAEKDRISVVITDMIMPDMSGGETFDRLKKVNPLVKVILSSGYSLDGEAARILKRGCNGFIQKPFDLRRLSLKLREILD